MDRWLRNLVAAFATAVVLYASGCSGSGEADQGDPGRGQPTIRVNADDQVTVLARKGDVTLVRTPDGATGFVPSDRVRIETSADSQGDVGAMTAASELDWQPPEPAKAEPVPRPIAEIQRERNQLGVLYLSADGSQEFLRPKLVGPFIDPESGKVCWPAFTCKRSDCQGLQSPTGRPVFAGVLNYLTVNPDGTYSLGAAEEQHGLVCPACGSKEGLGPYVLPETAARMKELAEEHRQRLAWERQNR